MALTLDAATRTFLILQADLIFVSGATYELDTDAFRIEAYNLLASETYMYLEDCYQHNKEVTVAGTTFARVIEWINGFSIQFENLVYSVRLAGSNNNLFDVDNGILIPSGNVTVIGQNSAGLIVSSESLLVKQILANHSTILVNGDGSRVITVLDSDDDSGATVGVWTVTPDGLIRERTT